MLGEMDLGYCDCRFCGTRLRYTFVDLGMSPLCQTHISPAQLNHMEPFYPLHAYVCHECFLVQLDTYVAPGDIFSDYAYFSSYSDSWVEHARVYVEAMTRRFGLDTQSQVVELASNDGYLLQHFARNGIPVLGVEPAANVARVAQEKGIPTIARFFGRETAREIAKEAGQADLLLGNNVLAHVPDLNDFVAGMKILLKRQGVITMEFPHLCRLIERNQFDTIYHEHFSYFSFLTVEKVFAAHGLTLFDVEEIETHGGSLRIFARHTENEALPICAQAGALKQWERDRGFTKLEAYFAFAEQVKETKRAILEFLIGAKRAGKSVAGYGAPGKGNTLLNYCGIRTDFLDFTVDANPYKQGKYTPGTRIPIISEADAHAMRPDCVLVMPWHFRGNLVQREAAYLQRGGKMIFPLPEIETVER